MKSTHAIAISLSHVTKQYMIHHEKPTLTEKILRTRDEKFYALNDINLIVERGERIGIIGPNGSGKTTLLKIIAGITSPTKGVIKTFGKVVSLIDLEAGFHPDLAGYQNIFLNGMLLGMNRKEINQKLDAIIDFSGIRRFIDSPLYTYSDGMKLRLGLSIAIYTNPDIILLDEGINVGDRDFRIKSLKKIQEFFQQRKTILLASHRLDIIKQNCTRILLMQNGKITQSGSPRLISQYIKAHSGNEKRSTDLSHT